MAGLPGEIQLTVDKAKFLEVGRIFKRVYRPRGAKDVMLTLRGRHLCIEFDGGGAELPGIGGSEVTVRVAGGAFSRLITAYRHDKFISATVTWTFQPVFA